jgi:hypothetical protein
MATFHVIGNLGLTILVADFGVNQVTKNVLCAMFMFQRGSLHVSKDIYYAKDNVVLSYVYQVLDVNLGGMFWTINKARYQIICENVLNNSQDIVLTSGTTTLVANIVAQSVVMKEEPNVVSPN